MHRVSSRVLLGTTLLLIATAASAQAPKQTQAANSQAARATPPVATSLSSPPSDLTVKERLSEKWTDEQRVDNCKVPPDKRGPKPRPDACSTVPTD